MSDPYFIAIQDQWENIRSLYMMCESKKPIILYDIQEDKIYAYPYKEFKAELSKKSQASLERDYKSASTTGRMVVFVRDNRERKLGLLPIKWVIFRKFGVIWCLMEAPS